MSVINRLRTDVLDLPEIKYVEDRDEYLRLVSKHRRQMREEFEEEFEEIYEKRAERKLKRVTKKVKEEVTKEVTKEVMSNFIRNLCLNSDFSNERIAFLTGADLNLVELVRASINTV
ncbi:MAG: hypothetical protein U5L45_05965 [Saprospiraceae bacterium]|nr:hypothetical protein [Saprospiraceae bacterium]